MLAQGRREREGLSQCDAAGHRLLEALRHGQARSPCLLGHLYFSFSIDALGCAI